MLRTIIDANIRFCRAFDQLIPARFTIDGNRDFVEKFVSPWLRQNAKIVDIGGGKNPFLSTTKKRELGAHVIGVDVSQCELSRAPAYAYDQVICQDITEFVGDRDADICICQAVLEHVPDTQAAFRGIASALKPGGVALVFVPSRNAAFARLNLLLPQRWKQFLLYSIFPNTRRNQGFPSYYNRCTPLQFERMARSVGLEVVDARYYFTSSYFSFFAPLYVVWRFWTLLFHAIAGKQSAETFSYAFKKADPGLSIPVPSDSRVRSAA